ncbi:MAG: tetratricopeptide repeat protein [Deferrisomatales bacterium]|nr:tetratricopeptide repeat protein [Deferrisomatales bacterium]
MASMRTVRLDHVILLAVGCLVAGYLLGIGTAVVIQGKPAPVPGPVAGPAAPVAPPGTALGTLQAEIRELRNIVESNPESVAAWVRLGNLYFDTDQFMESIDAYSRALELQPDNPDVITDRAIMYRSIGDFQRAASEFRRAAEISPTHLNSLLNLGVVLRYDLNDAPGAILAWKGYLARNPPPEMAEKISREIATLQGR